MYLEKKPEFIEKKPEFIEKKPEFIEKKPEFIEKKPEFIKHRDRAEWVTSQDAADTAIKALRHAYGITA